VCKTSCTRGTEAKYFPGFLKKNTVYKAAVPIKTKKAKFGLVALTRAVLIFLAMELSEKRFAIGDGTAWL